MSRSHLIPLVLLLGCPGDDESPAADDGTATGTATTSTSGGTATDSGSDTEPTTTLPVTATDSGSDTGTDTGTDTGPTGCMTDDDCPDPDFPGCAASGECVTCDQAPSPTDACVSLDAGTDICDGNICVQCTTQTPDACDGTTPVCDGDTFSCVACTEHADCPDTACNLPTGACIEGSVVHVDGDGGRDADTIADGLAMLAAGDGVLVIHEQGGQQSYQESVTHDGGTVAFLAASGEAPTWQGTGAPTLTVTGTATALLADMTMRLNGDAEGLRVDGATAYVQRSRLVQNTGGGIVALGGAELVVENCFVAGALDVSAVNVQSSNAAIVYSTVGTTTLGSVAALTCNGAATVGLRNSIVATNGGAPGTELGCGLDVGVGNWTEDAFEALDPSWFSNFNNGDYLLTPSGDATFADIATWQTGDPHTDIDGQPRVAIDGQAEHAGADVP